MVGTYSHLQLTIDSDKLPAFSGLARRVASSKPQAKYLAGLWSDNMDEGLLWVNMIAIYSIYPTPKPVLTTSPSWSWVSVNAPVFNLISTDYFGSSQDNTVLQYFFTISGAQTTLATEDPTGEVKGGSIIITASLYKAESRKNAAAGS